MADYLLVNSTLATKLAPVSELRYLKVLEEDRQMDMPSGQTAPSISCALAVSLVFFGSAAADTLVTSTPFGLASPFELTHPHFQESQIKCNAILKGEINDRSVQEVIEQLARVPARFPDTYAVLCLDSMGGELPATSTLLRFMIENLAGANGIVTFVPEGATCGSGCALVLLTGFACSTHFCYMKRYMHAKSTVWFHSPFIEAKGSALEPKLAAIAFSDGIETIRTILDPLTKEQWIDEDIEHRLTPEMLAIILRHTGDSKYYIETINDAMTFKIAVIGKFIMPALGFRSVIDACDNAHIFRSTFSNRAKADSRSTTYSLYEGMGISRLTAYWWRSWAQCSLSGLEGNMSDKFVDSVAIETGDNLSLGGRGMDLKEFLDAVRGLVSPSQAWLFHPSETRISDIVFLETADSSPVIANSMAKDQNSGGMPESIAGATAATVKTYRLWSGLEERLGITIKECRPPRPGSDNLCFIEDSSGETAWIPRDTLRPNTIVDSEGFEVWVHEDKYRVNSDSPAGYYNVRSGPSASYPVIFKIPASKGGIIVMDCETTDIISEIDEWCLIRLDENKGWIWSGDIEAE